MKFLVLVVINRCNSETQEQTWSPKLRKSGQMSAAQGRQVMKLLNGPPQSCMVLYGCERSSIDLCCPVLSYIVLYWFCCVMYNLVWSCMVLYCLASSCIVQQDPVHCLVLYHPLQRERGWLLTLSLSFCLEPLRVKNYTLRDFLCIWTSENIYTQEKSLPLTCSK